MPKRNFTTVELKALFKKILDEYIASKPEEEKKKLIKVKFIKQVKAMCNFQVKVMYEKDAGVNEDGTQKSRVIIII